jgi:hypothetical protein
MAVESCGKSGWQNGLCGPENSLTKVSIPMLAGLVGVQKEANIAT